MKNNMSNTMGSVRSPFHLSIPDTGI